MPNLGPAELILILAVALVVFGPKKLPEIGKGLGNALREFNKARNDFMDSLHADASDDDRVHTSSYSSHADSSPALSEPEGTVATGKPTDRSIEYPEPLSADTADALPYGSDFHAVEGDSQPSFPSIRTAEPESPVASAANGTVDHAGSAGHPLGAADGKA